MKKYLLLASVAALTFSSCSDQSTEFVGDKVAQQAREITFSPVAKPTTRAAVQGTTFPTANAMQVVAYDVTNSRDFFTATEFTHDTGTIWHGGKYWPLSAAYINFLAYTGFNGDATDATDETTGATWDITSGSPSAKASGVTLVMDDNSGNQKDLMYAIGSGEVSQSGNTLTFPTTNVPMTFEHAQAWISFYADAFDATSGGKVTLDKITLNGAKYAGTYTITYTNYNASSSQSVAGVWNVTGVATQNIDVPGWTAAAIAYDGTGNGQEVGNGLMIVPDDDNTTPDFTSFTITYTLDGNQYTYTYAPASTNVEQKKHYIYNINFHLHEILIDAHVTNWADQTAVDVPIF